MAAVVAYKKLLVWQRANELAFLIYRATRTFPTREIYGVTSQLRRAALSVSTNIVEGSGRQHAKETKQFLNLALGSLAEVEYLLSFCHRLGYLGEESYSGLDAKRSGVGKLLWRFYCSFR